MTREQSQMVGGVLLLIVALSAMGAMLWAVWLAMRSVEHVGHFQILRESVQTLARAPLRSQEFRWLGFWS